jgi:SAM-dependent methyltransferase
MFDDLQCKRADIMKGIPMDDKSSDMIICQEGIEHFSNQLKVFKEFNRVLSKNGELVITTPSYSNLSSKFSYMLFESEISKKMPPNEIDDIWMSDKTITNEIYHGHIFLIGLQKLRVLGKLSGFRIKEIKYLRLSKGSIFLFPILYPLILIRSVLVYRRHLKRNKKTSIDKKINVYKEQLFININPLNLLNKHTFITFTKECDVETINFRNEEIVKKFNKTM